MITGGESAQKRARGVAGMGAAEAVLLLGALATGVELLGERTDFRLLFLRAVGEKHRVVGALGGLSGGPARDEGGDGGFVGGRRGGHERDARVVVAQAGNATLVSLAVSLGRPF